MHGAKSRRFQEVSGPNWFHPVGGLGTKSRLCWQATCTSRAEAARPISNTKEVQDAELP